MRTAFLALALLTVFPPLLCAEAGRTGAAVLTFPLASRPLGMGNAFTAVEGGVDCLGYNPAGMARLEKPELETTYLHGIAGDNFGFAGYSHPLSRAVITGGLLYYNAGTVDLNFSNGTQQTVTAEQDMAGIAALSVPLSGGFSAGAAAKVFRLQLADQVNALGYAADLGVLWRSPLKGLNFGASVQNLGPDVKFEEEGDPLPMTVRFGAAYDLNLSKMDWFREGGYGFSRFLFTADAIKRRDESALQPSGGIEMGMNVGDEGYGALRAGYLFNQAPGYFTVGIGLRQGRWFFDYAFGGMKDDVSSTHHVTLGVTF